MASVNKVILVGNLGKDPEVRTSDNGKISCSFTLATKDNYYDKEKNQRVDLETEWHSIYIGLPGLVKVAQQYLKKGMQVYLEGSLHYSQREKEGQTRYYTSIIVSNMVMMSAKTDGATQQASVNEPAATPYIPSPEDDLPF